MTSDLARQGHRLLQFGVKLILFASVEGSSSRTRPRRRSRSPHTASPHSKAFSFSPLGLVWPRLRLGRSSSRMAFWLLVYSSLAILAAYLLGALWGVGAETTACRGNGAR